MKAWSFPGQVALPAIPTLTLLCLLAQCSMVWSSAAGTVQECMDAAYSVGIQTPACPGRKLRARWTAPSNRSTTVAVCFFKGANTLPHGCAPLPPPNASACALASVSGHLSLPASSPLELQPGQAWHAILASDCDETSSAAWRAAMAEAQSTNAPKVPNTPVGVPQGCRVLAMSSSVPVDSAGAPSCAQSAALCGGGEGSGPPCDGGDGTGPADRVWAAHGVVCRGQGLNASFRAPVNHSSRDLIALQDLTAPMGAVRWRLWVRVPALLHHFIQARWAQHRTVWPEPLRHAYPDDERA